MGAFGGTKYLGETSGALWMQITAVLQLGSRRILWQDSLNYMLIVCTLSHLLSAYHFYHYLI